MLSLMPVMRANEEDSQERASSIFTFANSRTSGRGASSTSFFPFSSSTNAVDDSAAAGRSNRMCRPQRIRPSSCVQIVHSHHRRPNQNHSTQRHFTGVDHRRNYHRSNHIYVNRLRTDNMSVPREPAEAPLPAPAPTVETEEQTPRRRSLWQALRRNCHWKCFILTLMIDGCLAVVFWCQLTQRSYFIGPVPLISNSYETRKNACEQGYNFIPVAFAVMLYVVYIMECWHCRTRLDLLCKSDVQSIYDYVNQLRDAMPVVWWRAICYHYVRKTRQVTRYRNGDAVTSTQVYYERVNSHTAGSAFAYQECGIKDVTKKLVGLHRFPVTRIRFRKGFVFANLQAANEFEEQRARFFQENEQRDDYMEVREGMDLIHAQFKENMVAFADPAHRPWFIAQATFWLCSLSMLSWPLRVLIEYRTAYVNYQVTKLFGTNYLSPGSQNYTGPLTRVSTMDSGDLEAVLRNNYVIVPSYSEALLMDPIQSRTAITANGSVHIRTTRPNADASALDGVPFPSPRRLLPGENTNVVILNNERVIANYGALVNEARSPYPRTIISRGCAVHPDPSPGRDHTNLSPFQHLIASAQKRSRSLSFLLFGTRSPSEATQNHNTPHSISFGSLSALARANMRKPYSTLPATPENDGASERAMEIVHLLHDRAEAPEEPPPSYDLAMKLCQPVGYCGGETSGNSKGGKKIKWFSKFSSGSSSAVSPYSPVQNDNGDNESDTVL